MYYLTDSLTVVGRTILKHGWRNNKKTSELGQNLGPKFLILLLFAGSMFSAQAEDHREDSHISAVYYHPPGLQYVWSGGRSCEDSIPRIYTVGENLFRKLFSPHHMQACLLTSKKSDFKIKKSIKDYSLYNPSLTKPGHCNSSLFHASSWKENDFITRPTTDLRGSNVNYLTKCWSGLRAEPKEEGRESAGLHSPGPGGKHT